MFVFNGVSGVMEMRCKYITYLLSYKQIHELSLIIESLKIRVFLRNACNGIIESLSASFEATTNQFVTTISRESYVQ